MISELRIKDYALMEKLEVGFSDGLSILTGETGAGKSIIIGALGLALGVKGDAASVRAGKRSAEVEAVFDLAREKGTVERLERAGYESKEQKLILKRILHGSGRTRCYLNDELANLGDLKTVSDLLVDIHGQHEHQALLRTETHIDFLDGFAGSAAESEEFRRLFDRQNSLTQEIVRSRAEAERLRDSQELYRFQKSEIETAKLRVGEEEDLDIERRILENSEKLILAASEAYERLYDADGSASETASEAKKLLEDMCRVDPSVGPHLEELTGIIDRFGEMGRDLDDYRNKIQHDPERLEEVRSRIDVIKSLKKKYGGSVDSVLKYGQHVEAELKRLEKSSFDVSELEKELRDVLSKMTSMAAALSEKRKKSAKVFESRVLAELKGLGMTRCRFAVEVLSEESDDGVVVLDGKKYTTWSNGIDKVEFLLSANPGEPVRPLARIASGGETSRVMLALKSILSDVDRVSTLIFDEIDIGIGGRVAESVGKKLRKVADFRQVICITHLPQIAVFGENHYVVRKETKGKKTYTLIDALGKEERVAEIARMLGGEEITEATVRAAREMLENAR
jgi:DNA repair protein RecN (Recombination protein N)